MNSTLITSHNYISEVADDRINIFSAGQPKPLVLHTVVTCIRERPNIAKNTLLKMHMAQLCTE